MELKKTTVLSSLVCIAGLITEIIFCDVMSKSIFGVVLSIIMAVVILAAAYFVIDGIRSYFLGEKERKSEHEKEYEQRLYSVLNEQLQFQKEIYRGVYATQSPENLFADEREHSKTEEEKTKDSEELIHAINDNVVTAAKTVARYVNKNTTEVKSIMDNNQKSIVELLQSIESNQQRLLELLEKKE